MLLERSAISFDAILNSHAANGTPRHSNRARFFKREMKNIGSKILRRVAIPHPPRDVSVHALEMRLVQICKPPAIPLRRGNQVPLRRITPPPASTAPTFDAARVFNPLSGTFARLLSRVAERAYKDADRGDT